MMKLMIFVLLLPLSVVHAHELKFVEERSPYEILKDLYDKAPKAASPADFVTMDELRKDRLSGYRIMTVALTGIGDESIWVTPEVESRQLQSWQKVFLLKNKTRFVIEAGTEARQAEDGHGPLFPPKPAVPSTGDVCGENMALWPVVDVDFIPSPLKDNCKTISKEPSDKNPYELGFSQTPQDLIFSIGYKREGRVEKRTTIYYRKSGDLIAMKFIIEKFYPAHRIKEAYNYGFKDRYY